MKEKLQQKIKLVPEHWMASLMDPGYRQFLFVPAENRQDSLDMAKGFVVNAADEIIVAEANVEASPSKPPPVKKSKLDVVKKYRSSTVADTIVKMAQDELNSYLVCPVSEDLNEDNPLEFWHMHRLEFPRLYELSARLFVIPASSASSERSFSTAGRVIEQRRTQLNPGTINAIMTVRSERLQKFNKQDKKT